MDLPARVSLSPEEQKRLNNSKKRKININKWKKKKRKEPRNAGEPYISKNKKPFHGKLPTKETTAWYQITKDEPITLRATSHNILQPWMSHCSAKKIKHINKYYPSVKVLEFPCLYTTRFGIKPAKKKDLDDMCRFIPAEFKDFRRNESIKVEGGSEPSINM
ncbi:hypothetical protein WA026_012996 [Henosepilachna vigintioctopunctata]|uniref:Uncharacterized protein n=1 Tax=Henosepilachna vigintioctopunctata TaxID=420089 RepID=A0AAW1TK97_9CUCU